MSDISDNELMRLTKGGKGLLAGISNIHVLGRGTVAILIVVAINQSLKMYCAIPRTVLCAGPSTLLCLICAKRLEVESLQQPFVASYKGHKTLQTQCIESWLKSKGHIYVVIFYIYAICVFIIYLCLSLFI